MSAAFWITVPGRCVPKPRMTRQDRWKKRPRVVRYRKFASDVIEAYVARKKDIGRFCDARPVLLGFKFGICGGTGDIKNWIAGIEDALVGWALEDDNWRVVRGYFKAEVVEVAKAAQYTKIGFKEGGG